jgi:squalene cyclase
VNTAKSVSFVEERGSELEKARMRHVLFGAPPAPDVVDPFVRLQNPDGGFPCAMVQANPSAVHKTVNGLWWLDELGLLASSPAGKAFRYLFGVQQGDGGWDEDPDIALYGLPPWIRPGDLATRVYLSSYAAYWLAVAGHETHPAFRAALRFLLQHRDETGRFYGFHHSTWIATSVFAMAGPEYAEIAEQGLQALLDRPLPEWPVEHICWALAYLGRAGLPGEHPLIERGLAELLHRRRSDGSWASPEDESGAVTTTQALKVLKHYGLVQFDP